MSCKLTLLICFVVIAGCNHGNKQMQIAYSNCNKMLLRTIEENRYDLELLSQSIDSFKALASGNTSTATTPTDKNNLVGSYLRILKNFELSGFHSSSNIFIASLDSFIAKKCSQDIGFIHYDLMLIDASGKEETANTKWIRVASDISVRIMRPSL
ncbi:MAG: hypothetical protein RL660_398 [Bacteroidota bacterium]|jgi:hypothetical protein